MNPSNTYALVIGINQYQCPDYSVLEAAVNDADAVDTYLRTTLNVPKENVINIRNAQASRQGILNSFQRLEKITAPAQQPCIIIFYAGHGARTEKPPQWLDWATDSDFVEMLCPCDIGIELEDGEGVVEGIPDRTVCYLLNQLSTLRGNNITLILDCCCSAGLNRGGGTYTPRSILNPPRLSGKADPRVVITGDMAKQDESTTTRGMKPSAGFGGKFQDSHVLLAACGRERFAFENEGRGLFTTALLSTFTNINLRTTTYTSLMDRLKMPKWQTPHCEGSYMDRLLFDRGGIRSDASLIPGKRYKNETNELVVSLDAGMAQGVTLGELFSIHESNLLDTGSNINPSIGILSATTVDSFSTLLDHPKGHRKFKIPRNFYARRIDWRNDPPKVYCRERAWLESVFPPNSAMQQIHIVNSPADAALVLELEGERVYIERNDPVLEEYLPKRLPHSLRRDSPRDIQNIIKAWQHFNYHLHRRGKNEFAQVRMELQYLEQIDPDDDEEPENYRPTGQNLLAREPSEIQVPDADVDKPVGMTLYNDSDIPIYPYLFYFDPNELTIIPWFTAPHGAGSGEVDAPLAPQSKFAVGYANGAASPWQFCFEDERVRDIGFFKLFLSGSPANFACIAQDESPFKRIGTATRGPGGTGSEAQVGELEKLDKYSWGVKAATIIQIRE